MIEFACATEEDRPRQRLCVVLQDTAHLLQTFEEGEDAPTLVEEGEVGDIRWFDHTFIDVGGEGEQWVGPVSLKATKEAPCVALWVGFGSVWAGVEGLPKEALDVE